MAWVWHLIVLNMCVVLCNEVFKHASHVVRSANSRYFRWGKWFHLFYYFWGGKMDVTWCCSKQRSMVLKISGHLSGNPPLFAGLLCVWGYAVWILGCNLYLWILRPALLTGPWHFWEGMLDFPGFSLTARPRIKVSSTLTVVIQKILKLFHLFLAWNIVYFISVITLNSTSVSAMGCFLPYWLLVLHSCCI